jgi:hypothetical protein
MAQFVAVPVARLQADVLQALLEEFACRDGTDYGERECSLQQKVDDLRRQIAGGELQLLFDTESEHWDLVPRDEAARLLDE